MLGRGGRGPGRGPIPFPKYSTIHVNELKTTTTLDTHEDITLDSDSEESLNWKEQMSVMTKDLRDSIMVDVKDMMDENLKEFMREISTSVRNDINKTLKEVLTTKIEDRKLDLTPNSQPEPITQDTLQLTPRAVQLNNLIEEMEIEKKPNKRKTPSPSEETQNQEDQEAIETNSESASKMRAGTRKSRQKKTLPKGQKQA